MRLRGSGAGHRCSRPAAAPWACALAVLLAGCVVRDNARPYVLGRTVTAPPPGSRLTAPPFSAGTSEPSGGARSTAGSGAARATEASGAARATVGPRAAPATVIGATAQPTDQPTADADRVALVLAPVASDLDQPLFVTHAGDRSGRLFIVEKSGVVRALATGSGEAGVFLDLRDRVGAGASEQGLLGLAFHPDFARNRRLYVSYTDRQGASVVSELRATADGSAGIADSERRLLEVEQPAANHNGGMIAFGPDRRLYIGLGDGGGAGDRYGHAQNLETLLGAILRIEVPAAASSDDPPYSIPRDNPFLQTPGARPEIWAYGLRNPWRFAFDRATGDLYIGDVGQAELEEIDLQRSSSHGGENYGWALFEGDVCYGEESACSGRGDLTMPILVYEHGEEGCSVTGGYVYRGMRQPGLRGLYLFGDYCSGRIWAAVRDANGRWGRRLLADTDLAISSFGEDEFGEVYVTDLDGGVYRLTSQSGRGRSASTPATVREAPSAGTAAATEPARWPWLARWPSRTR